MNWFSYLRNIIKSKHKLIMAYIDLSNYICEMHADYKDKLDAQDAHIELLKTYNDLATQNMLIHANEKRKLIKLLKERVK
jgi:hypothetical protein